MALYFFLLLFMGAPSFGNTVSDAETVRLRSEMKMLAKRDAWTGVDRAFRAAHALQPELTFDDYPLGAFAAQALGDPRPEAFTRSMHRKSKTVLDWLWNIDTEYVPVRLAANSRRINLFGLCLSSTKRNYSNLHKAHWQKQGVSTFSSSGTYTLGGFTFDVGHDTGPVRIDTRVDREKHSPRRLTLR